MLNFVVIALFAAAPAAEANADRAPPTQAPSEMTNAEIKAHNEGLAATHPHYIKCRKIEEIGSWVKKARVCRTNEQWKKAWAQGNQNARDTAEAMTRAPVNSN
ncbi:hypothetical protein [Sphingopyxis sp. LK2115]|jgi:predicted component of type VI protein secretion system|uniref:hypothetical protein n=1 Tax=Sphingopyxis sp. LK2115 TaxID=2744558 RepID=UPI00166053EA|nr:hypothetical protein [Sphingopyxis sp. LK2115]